MLVIQIFVKGKYDAAEMYLGDGFYPSELKSKSLILEAGASQTAVSRIQLKGCCIRSIDLHTPLKSTLTHVQKDIYGYEHL